MAHIDERSRFLEVVSHESFAGSGSVWLGRSSWDKESLALSLFIEPRKGEPHQRWKVRVRHAVEERLSGEWGNHVYVGGEHPGLIPWVEEEVEVYFARNRLSAPAILGIAAAACATTLQDFYPVSRFLNGGLGLLSGECGGYGLLGRFPRSVASAIVDAIPSDSLSVRVLNPRLPKYQDGNEHKPYPSTLEIFTFGKTYVIGDGLTFEAD